MKRRILSLLVCLCLIISMVPSMGISASAATVGTAANPEYSPTYLPFVPLNIDTYDNGGYIKSFVMNYSKTQKDNLTGPHAMNQYFTGKIKNLNKKFKDPKARDWPTNLSQTNTFYKSGAEQYSFEFKYEVKSGAVHNYINDNNGNLKWVLPFKVKNQHKKVNVTENRHSLIQIKISNERTVSGKIYTQGTSEYHSQKDKKGNSEYKGNATAVFGFNHSTEIRDGKDSVSYGQPDYITLKKNTTLFKVQGNTGGGHEPSLDYTNLPIFMADTTAPNVTKITTTDGTNSKTKFKAGETVYFEVEFNEYIRTYDDSKDTLKALKLEFQMSGSTTREKADCVALEGKKLIFCYKVPSSSTKKINNLEIKNIYEISKQNWITESERSKVAYAYKRGDTKSSFNPASSSDWKSLRTTSAIVDMAGNSVSSSNSKSNLEKSISVDNIAPTVYKFEASADTNDKTNPYVNKDNTITVTAVFDEPVTAKSGGIDALKGLKLKTNVKSGSSYLELGYKTHITEKGGIKQMTFSGKIPQNSAAQGTDYIKITEILNSSGTKAIVDMFGNEITTESKTTALPGITQQYVVDNVLPVVSCTLNSDGKAEVSRYSNKDESAFYVPVNVSDALSGLNYDKMGIISVSGNIDGQPADIPFQYKVSAYQGRPDSYDAYISGSSYFRVLEGTHYFHIDLLEEKLSDVVDNLSITVSVFDNAMNLGQKTVPLEYTGDFGETEFELLSTESKVDIDKSKVAGVQRIEIRDASNVRYVYSQWVPSGEEIDESAWTTDNISEVSGVNTRLWTGTFTSELLALDVNHGYTLYTKVTDGKGDTVISQGFPMNIYAGGASFSYSTTTAGMQLVDHELIIGRFTDEVNDVPKTITVTVKGDFDSSGVPGWTITKTPQNLTAVSVDPITKKETHELVFFFAFDVFDPSEWYFEGERAMEIIRHLYGRVEVNLTCENTSSGAISSTDMEFYFMREQPAGTEIHEVTIEALNPNNEVVTLGENSEYTGPDSGVLLPRSLKGHSIKAEIGGNLLYPDYGVSDVDFEASYIEILDSSNNQIVKAALSSSGSTNLTLPNEMKEAVTSGALTGLISGERYKARVVLTDLAGKTQREVYENIIFDSSVPESYGITKVTSKSKNPDNTVRSIEEIYDIGVQSPEIYVSSAVLSGEAGGSQPCVDFEMNYPDSYLKQVYIKVWNETLEETKSDADWEQVTFANGKFKETFEFFSKNAADIPDNNAIRITDGVNKIKYCFITATGYETDVNVAKDETDVKIANEFTVYAASQQPQLLINADGYEDKWTQSIEVTANAVSTVCAQDELEILCYTDVSGTAEETGRFLEEREMTITENGDYYFGIADKYQNVVWYYYQVENIDTTAPEIGHFISILDSSEAVKSPRYYFNFTATDNKSEPEDITVYVTVDDAFAEDLGLAKNEETDSNGISTLVDFNQINFDENPEHGGQWISISDTLDVYKNVDAYGVDGIYPYIAEDGEPTPRTFTVHVRDAAGNETTKSFNHNQSNQKPELLHAIASADGTNRTLLMFNVPVKFTSPLETMGPYGGSPEFHWNKWVDWVYKNGDYQVEFVDAWGNTGTAEFTIDTLPEFYDADVSVSTLEPTNQDVKVTVDVSGNDNIHIGLMTSTAGGVTLPYTVESQITDSIGALKTVVFSAPENCKIEFKLIPYNPDITEEPVYAVNIGNIRKEAPKAEVAYYPGNEVDENNVTWGNVEAVLKSLDDRELSVTEGEAVYNFVKGGPEEYIFRYHDEYGNTGEITARCPYIIVDQPEETIDREDVTAPEYAFEVLVNQMGNQIYGGRYVALPDSSNPLPMFGTSLTFLFMAYDDNEVSYSVEGAGDGVTVLGSMVTVTKNTSFTMVLTDVMGNKTRIPINVNTKATALPKGEVIYEDNADNGTVRAYININLPGNAERGVRLIGASSLGYDGDKAMYYKDFYDNGTYLFNLMDDYGITAGITAAVSKIDSTTPVGKVTRSSPGIFDGDDENAVWKGIDTTDTRQNVVMTVSFTKDEDGSTAYIRSITPSIVSGAGILEDVTVENYGDRAVITYNENARVRIDFTAANGRSGYLILPEVDYIVRGNDFVRITNVELDTVTNGGITKSVTLTFTADRQVYFTKGGWSGENGSLVTGTVFTKKLTKNGDYSFSFVDKAQNQTDLAYTATQINSYPPVLTLSGFMEPVSYTNRDLAVKAWLDMAGTIRHMGQDYPVNARQEIDLSLPYNGLFEIMGIGANGLSDSEIVTVTKIDKTAPVITAAFGSVWAELDADYEDILKNNVVVAYDNIDGILTDKVNVVINSGNRISAAGTYTVTYEVTDDAGNRTALDGSLTVYDDTYMAVHFDGLFAQPGALTVIKGDENVQITTNLGNEPHKIYYARGVKTAAQMKYDGLITDGNLTLNKDTYYTIYIITQDRREFIGRILIEK